MRLQWAADSGIENDLDLRPLPVFARAPLRCVRLRLTALRAGGFIDSLHSCLAERKRGAGRGGSKHPCLLAMPQPSTRFRPQPVANGAVKKLAKPPALPSYMGSSTAFGVRLSSLRMTGRT